MKQFIMYFSFLAFVSEGTLARAESVPQLEGYFGRKLTQFQGSLRRYNSSVALQEEALNFQDIQIWIAPEATIGVNSVLALTIAPEIVFVLTPPAH